MSETTLRTGPTIGILPNAAAATPRFAGFDFITGPKPPATPGLVIHTRQIGPLLYPVLIQDVPDIAAALAAPIPHANGHYWLPRDQPRQRTHIARDLIAKYHPPLNTEHRKGPTAPELAELVPDQATGLQPAPPPIGPITVTEAQLAALVEHFYAAARQDALVGPVFNRTVTDWDHHARIVANFWSRSLLGTTRYNGHPFAAHLTLGLKPQHFQRWIDLFKASAGDILPPEAAAFAVAKVEHMSTCFQNGLFLPPLSP